jgi:hypothetical protein
MSVTIQQHKQHININQKACYELNTIHHAIDQANQDGIAHRDKA